MCRYLPAAMLHVDLFWVGACGTCNRQHMYV
jgi:hypothetical protein